MKRTQVVVIGAGQAGLAMSRCLTDRGIDHVVFDRGRIAERWRSSRWASLRLLTPNWQTRLPDFRYDGPEPNGYMTVSEVVTFLDRYAALIAAPIESNTTVELVCRSGNRFTVTTTRAHWCADAVVTATGYADLDAVPAIASHLPPDVEQLTASTYKRPEGVRDGAILIVGASASGVQLAHELRQQGRRVVLAVGRHLRLPRLYRGRDICWWLDRAGIFDESFQDVYDIALSRTQPSFQLVGRPDRASIDLATLQDAGVEICGRLLGIDGDRVTFADDLVATTAASDIKLAGLLRRLDQFIERERSESDWVSPPPFQPTWTRFVSARRRLGLQAARVRSVIWASGFRRAYPWLRVGRALDGRGEIAHDAGVTAVPGLYALGLQFLRRRNSSFIDGVGRDASELADHLARYLRSCRRVA